jgi:hypothetical protein
MPGLRGRRTLTVLVITGAVLGLSTAAVYAGARGDSHPATPPHHGYPGHGGKGFPPNVDRFNLSGYKIEASYSLGRNTGNTFEQTYTGTTVQGVPVAGPFVGTTFPPQDYVALPIGHKQLYIVWQDPATHAIVDAFVMNFKTGVVFDYAPGSAQPESSGTVRILEHGPMPLP